MATETSHPTMSSVIKDAIVELLGSRICGCTAREIAAAVGLHVTTTRVHLNALADSGAVLYRDERVGVGRPLRRYFPSPQIVQVAELKQSYHLLAEVLDETLRADVDSNTLERIIQAWAERSIDRRLLGVPSGSIAWREQTEALMNLLRVWGYQPELEEHGEGRLRLALGRCPLFREDAQAQSAVCAAHLGMVRGAMGVLGSGDVQVSSSPQLPGGPCHLLVSRDTGNKGENL